MRSKFWIYNKVALTFSFLLFVGLLDAQQNKLKRKYFLNDFVFEGNHIQFNFATLSTRKARLKNQTGSHSVSSSATLGLLLSFKYLVNFNNEYSLIAGTEATILGRNFNTSINKNEFLPSLIKDYDLNGSNSYMGNMVLSLPVLLEKRWLYANTKYLYGEAGLRVNFSMGPDFDFFSINLQNINNDFIDAGGLDVNANNDAKPWISFPLNVGHAWLLKNNNVLQMAVCSNFSFTKYVNGSYKINIYGQPATTGKYSSNGSFIGISLNYVFTSTNYRIRKAYEKTNNTDGDSK